MLSPTTDIDQRSAILSRTIRRETGAIVRLREIHTSQGTIVVIDLIVVPDKKRASGRGRRAMLMICEAADLFDWELELLVDDYWGTPLPVLRAFYYSFGFRTVCSPSRQICMVRPGPVLNPTTLAPVSREPVSV